MLKKYDVIVGLGQACSCTQTLRSAGLQHLSFPFDWIKYRVGELNGTTELRQRVRSLVDEFADWFALSDLERYPEAPGTGAHEPYFNRRTHVDFLHDFPLSGELRRDYPHVREKYDRRIARMYNLIRRSKAVLFVILDLPIRDYPPTVMQECVEAKLALERKFGGTRVDFFVMSYSPGVPYVQAMEERFADGIVRLAFDYGNHNHNMADFHPDYNLTVAALKSRFAVDDYRTDRERRSRGDSPAPVKPCRGFWNWAARSLGLLGRGGAR